MLNKVILLGRTTKEPELKTSQGGTEICSFTLAVNRKFVKEGEERQADFIMCKAFAKTAASIAKHVSKGQQIVVEGRINTGKYEKDGQTIYTTDVIVDSFYFADSKKGGTSDADDSNAGNAPGFFPVDNSDDELPF